MDKNIVDFLVQFYGSQAALGKAIGIAQPSVNRWKQNNRVPMLRAQAIIEDAKGRGFPIKPEHFFGERGVAA